MSWVSAISTFLTKKSIWYHYNKERIGISVGIGGVTMDINQMKYFVEICAAGSMSRAAENLKMSQQGLSLAVRRLESELNCDLFYRKSSGLVLTEYGKMFKRESEEILRHVGNIYDFCSDLSSVMNITVSITTNLLVRLPTKIQNLLLSGWTSSELVSERPGPVTVKIWSSVTKQLSAWYMVNVTPRISTLQRSMCLSRYLSSAKSIHWR